MTEDELVQQILTQARYEVAMRRAERQERPWLYAFLGLALTLLIGVLFLPGSFADKLALVVHGVCAQQHRITIGGITMPLCARNTGIYSGFLATLIYLLALGRRRASRLPPLPITLVLVGFVLVMAIDGFNSLFLDLGLPHPYTPRNDLRVITGLGMGTATAVFLLFAFNGSVWAYKDRNTPVLRSWTELLGALLANALLFAGLYGGPDWMFYPLAIFSVTGIVGVLFGVNVLIIAVVSQQEEMVLRLRQLGKPATLALMLTAMELALLALARISIEGSL